MLVLELVLLESEVVELEESSCIRLFRSASILPPPPPGGGGGGGRLPPGPETRELSLALLVALLLDPLLSEPLLFELLPCACRASIRFCRNALSAWVASCVVLDDEDEELSLLDVLLLVSLLELDCVTPIAAKAWAIASISPPPGGEPDGGGGQAPPTSPLAAELLVRVS